MTEVDQFVGLVREALTRHDPRRLVGRERLVAEVMPAVRAADPEHQPAFVQLVARVSGVEERVLTELLRPPDRLLNANLPFDGHERQEWVRVAALWLRAARDYRAASDQVRRFKCFYCDRTAETADHVEARSRGGPDDVSNLVPACRACNNAKGAKTLRDFLEQRASRAAVVS